MQRHNDEIEKLKIPSAYVALMHQSLRSMMVPGTSTADIEKFVRDFAKRNGVTCAQIGYKGYPFATCAAVNDVIAHGFPNPTPLQDGDIVTIDTVFDVDGWKGDSAWTYAIGQIDECAKRLLDVTKQCLYKGIDKARVGNRTGDIGYAIQTHAEVHGFSVARDLLAHGIGRHIHEPPVFQHFGEPGTGPLLQEGMVITIEPMINEGTYDMYMDEDGWTVRTQDGKRSAQFEHTIVITDTDPLILTEQNK